MEMKEGRLWSKFAEIPMKEESKFYQTQLRLLVNAYQVCSKKVISSDLVVLFPAIQSVETRWWIPIWKIDENMWNETPHSWRSQTYYTVILV